MNILLVFPPIYDTGILSLMSATYPPQGLLMLAAVLENSGQNVSVIDCNAEEVDFEELKKRIIDFKPDMVGISVLSATRFSAFKTANLVKDINENCKVIAGGQHVTFLDEITLKKIPAIDIVVRGEGEMTVQDILNRPLKEIDGITYRDKDKIIKNPDRKRIDDLDILPLPAYHLVNMEKYFSNLKKFNPFHISYPATAVMTSRGCVNKCSFCSSTQNWKSLKMHSPGYVIKNIELLKNNYGVNDFIIYDDVFPITYKWLEEFFIKLKEKNIEISFQCLSRVTSIDDKIVDLMKQCGCYLIDFGIESGSSKILKSVDKRITIPQIEKAVDICIKKNILVRACFMIGFPEETLEDMYLTLLLIKNLSLSDFCISLTLLYPGSILYSNSKTDDNIWFDEKFKNELDFTQPNIPLSKNDNFKPADIVEIANYIVQEGFLSHFLKKLIFDIKVSNKNIFFTIINNIKLYIIRASKIKRSYFKKFDFKGHDFINMIFKTIYFGLFNLLRNKKNKI